MAVPQGRARAAGWPAMPRLRAVHAQRGPARAPSRASHPRPRCRQSASRLRSSAAQLFRPRSRPVRQPQLAHAGIEQGHAPRPARHLPYRPAPPAPPLPASPAPAPRRFARKPRPSVLYPRVRPSASTRTVLTTPCARRRASRCRPARAPPPCAAASRSSRESPAAATPRRPAAGRPGRTASGT